MGRVWATKKTNRIAPREGRKEVTQREVCTEEVSRFVILTDYTGGVESFLTIAQRGK